MDRNGGELPELMVKLSKSDISSMVLSRISAESNPKYRFVKRPEITERDQDGFLELMIKFDRSNVRNIVRPVM